MTLEGSRAALLAFVRGESPWRDLTKLGVDIQLGTRAAITVPADLPTVRPTLADVARGLCAHSDAADRRQWATVLLALDNIDLTGVEQEKEWPALLEGIWDASGGTVSDNALRLARDLSSPR